MSYAFLTETMLGMTWEEIDDAAKTGAVVLFPIGVVEAHGPHLPLGTDILHSLEQFGFTKVVFFNAHGDGLHRRSILEDLVKCNEELSLKAYWPVYVDDIQREGFKGDEDYLALILPMPFEKFFTMEQEPRDSFDVHAGAFETAMMQEIMPEVVRNEKIDGLEATMLKGEQIRLWNKGERVNIHLIPKGYVGDPAGSKFIKSDMRTVNEAFAKGLAEFLAEV